MSSWGPGFVQKKGHMNLSHYHHVGFESFASEYFKLIRSMIYTQNLNEFLFVFDKVNSVSTSIGLFEYTLKKNGSIRYLSYYPSSGFNVGDRKDLIEPALQKRIFTPNLPDFFRVFSTTFDLQDKIKESIVQIFNRKEIPLFSSERLGVCLKETIDISIFIKKIQQYPTNHQTFHLFVSGTREQCESFKTQCPSQWVIFSMWDVVPPNIVTEEQKMDVFIAYLGSFIALEHSEAIFGSFHDPVFRFLYCKEGRFRDPKKGVVLDGSSFSYF